MLIVKKLLAKHGLNKPYSGGLNSYSIVLMTSTFLKQCGCSPDAENSLSKNLSEFFNFFGNYFNQYDSGMNGEDFIALSEEQKNQISF